MKYSALPSAAHIGHASFAPPFVTWRVPGRGTARTLSHEPDLALVEMAVALAPPLRSGVGRAR